MRTCHNEYYFNGQTKVPANPYSGREQMTPDAILAYYDSMGFADWKYPGTDTPMIKVQHPEFETNYGGGGSYMTNLGYTCADCHMGKATAEDGTVYVNHKSGRARSKTKTCWLMTARRVIAT